MKKIAIFLVLALSTVLSLRALTLYTLTTNGFTYNVGAPSQQFGVVSNVYYVNQATGSDSYNGGSTNYPWQHIPGDTTAPGYGLSLTTAPAGSTIYIAGQYTLANAQIYVVGGPTNQPVTYASLPGQRAQIKGSYNTNLYWGPCLNSNIQAFVDVSAHGWSNVVFSNIDIGPIGGSLQVPPTNYFGTGVSAPPATGYGIGCAGAMINTTVVGCTFNGLGYYWNTVPMDASSLSGDGMDIYNFTNVSIINCTFKNARDGIFLGGLQGSGLLISNCNFLDALGWGITAPYLNGEYLDNINIAHCNWTNSDYSFSGPQWSGTGQWVHGNGIFFYGESVVESAGQSFTGGTNIAIHHCHFADPNQPATDVPIPARAMVKFKAGKEMKAEVLKLTPKSPKK